MSANPYASDPDLEFEVSNPDRKAVREKFLSAHIVAMTCLDGQVKILKNRFGSSGQSVPEFAFQKEFGNKEGVWLLTWFDAQNLLKGLVSL